MTREPRVGKRIYSSVFFLYRILSLSIVENFSTGKKFSTRAGKWGHVEKFSTGLALWPIQKRSFQHTYLPADVENLLKTLYIC